MSSERNTLKTPLVKAWIMFRAQPEAVRPDDCKTRKDFMQRFGIKSRTTLHLYEQIDGFHEALLREQKRYKAYYVTAANAGLAILAKGFKKTKTEYEGDGESAKITKKTIETMAPSVQACDLILKVFGDYTERVEHELIDKTQKKWIDAAERLDAKEDKEKEEADNSDGRH